MELSFDELLFLSRSDLKRKQVDMLSEKADGILPILVETKLVDDQGYLTDKGLKAANAVIPFFEAMSKGIPLDKRIRNEAKKALLKNSAKMGWVFGEYLKQTYCTNSEIIIVGKPVKSMQSQQGLSDTRSSVSTVLKTNVAPGKPSDWAILTPYAFQLCTDSDDNQLIWLVARKKQNLHYAIQAKYFDYIMERFPQAVFVVNTKKEEKQPIQARVTNRGWKNLVALIMPIDITGLEAPQEA